MISNDGERIAQLEAKVEAVHQDIHLIGDTFNRVWETIESLRRDLIGRPSWAVTGLLTLLTGAFLATLSTLLTLLVTR